MTHQHCHLLEEGTQSLERSGKVARVTGLSGWQVQNWKPAVPSENRVFLSSAMLLSSCESLEQGTVSLTQFQATYRLRVPTA